MKFGRLLSLAVVAAGLLVLGSESRAALITLPTTANNLEGNSVVFSNPSTTFSFQNLTATNTSLSGIEVNPLSPLGTPSSGTAVPPFGFQLAGGVVSAAQGQTSDLLVNYTIVSALPITSVTLIANGGTSPGGSASISETFIDGNTGLADGSFFFTGAGTFTFVLPTPTTHLIVSKDINVVGGVNGASYSDVRNVVNGAIPEPASVVMLGCGLVGALGLGLRRARKTV